MLFELKKESNATHTCKSICAVYGKSAVSERTCQKWFKRCRDGNFSLSGEPRSGRLSNVNEDCILEEVQKNPRRSVVELERLWDFTITDFIYRIFTWISRALSMQEVVICRME